MVFAALTDVSHERNVFTLFYAMNMTRFWSFVAHLGAFLAFSASTNLLAQPDLAPLRVTTNESPVPGFLYLAPNCRVSPPPYGAYLAAYNVNGGVLKTGRVTNYPFEYKVFPDGRIGYSELVVFAGASVPAGVYIVDTLFQVVELLDQQRGYLTTQHDFHMLPNGHRLLLGAEDVTIDMSTVVEGGHPAANVVQAVIQEIDCDGKVVMQWKALDHLPITDSYEDLTAPAIRYCHNNALWIDDDGNWLVSMRHMSQIIKVNSKTGEVMWKLGGKSNQFTIVGDHEELAPTYFSYQHDIRRLPNGNISLFDNGTQHEPRFSRGVEYSIDEERKICRMVWEYRHNPDYYVSIQGGMQTLDSGHRIIGWGSAASDGSAAVTEVDSNGLVVFEAFYPKQMFVYRATKYPVWPPGRPSANIQINNVLQGETYSYHNATRFTGVKVTFNEVSSFFYNSTWVKRFEWSPKNPQWPGESPLLHQSRVEFVAEGLRSAKATLRFAIDTFGITLDPTTLSVYYRPIVDSGRFAVVPSSWNPSTREITVQGAQMGEYCFGVASPAPNTPPVPLLYWPIGGLRVLENSTHNLRVTPNGRVDSVRIQVSRNKDMSSIEFDGTTQSDRIPFPVGAAGTMYYWRALTTAGAQQSAWSAVDSFRIAPAFLEITKPATDVAWVFDNRYPISWNTDISGDVRIELVKDGTVLATISDSVPAAAQGFLWQVPFTVPMGKQYHVRITSRDNNFGTIDVVGTANIEITNIVSVANTPGEEQGPVTVLPLPAHTNVVFENRASGCAMVEVYAPSGERVLRGTGTGTRITADVSHLASGVYMALVTDTRGRQYRIAVPVQH